MPKMVFINLPVRDLAAATRFYQAIGFVRNDRFSNDDAASMVWSDTIFVHLLTHGFYAGFSPKPIANAHENSAMLIALSFDSREEVDDIVARAEAAGGRGDVRPVQDMGFMYSRAFEDPDGNVYEPFWMDPQGMPEA